MEQPGEALGKLDVDSEWKNSKYTEEYLGKLGLNERQSKAVEYLRESKRITRQEYAFLFECSVRTAFNDLQGMIDKQILQRREKGRYTYYELA